MSLYDQQERKDLSYYEDMQLSPVRRHIDKYRKGYAILTSTAINLSLLAGWASNMTTEDDIETKTIIFESFGKDGNTSFKIGTDIETMKRDLKRIVDEAPEKLNEFDYGVLFINDEIASGKVDIDAGRKAKKRLDKIRQEIRKYDYDPARVAHETAQLHGQYHLYARDLTGLLVDYRNPNGNELLSNCASRVKLDLAILNDVIPNTEVRVQHFVGKRTSLLGHVRTLVKINERWYHLENPFQLQEVDITEEGVVLYSPEDFLRQYAGDFDIMPTYRSSTNIIKDEDREFFRNLDSSEKMDIISHDMEVEKKRVQMSDIKPLESEPLAIMNHKVDPNTVKATHEELPDFIKGRKAIDPQPYKPPEGYIVPEMNNVKDIEVRVDILTVEDNNGFHLGLINESTEKERYLDELEKTFFKTGKIDFISADEVEITEDDVIIFLSRPAVKKKLLQVYDVYGNLALTDIDFSKVKIIGFGSLKEFLVDVNIGNLTIDATANSAYIMNLSDEERYDYWGEDDIDRLDELRIFGSLQILNPGGDLSTSNLQKRLNNNEIIQKIRQQEISRVAKKNRDMKPRPMGDGFSLPISSLISIPSKTKVEIVYTNKVNTTK